MCKVENSVAVVTGANRGLGRAFVEQLLARRAKRVYAGARDPSKLRDVVSSGDGRVVALHIDLSDPASIVAAAKTAKDATLLINNAGALEFGSQVSADLAGIRRDFEINYFGTLQVTRAFVPALEANKNGAIVNVLAVVSLVSIPGLGGYSASKAAAHSLTLGLRGELSKRGISVHGAYPGPIDTDMTKRIDRPKARASDVASATLAGVEAGDNYIFPEAMSSQVYEGWRKSHAEVEAQFGASMIVPDILLGPEACPATLSHELAA
jgi:NAD(P)-dependent dehydrogenase (short-subunit alcohol dehydrogenase family)